MNKGSAVHIHPSVTTRNFSNAILNINNVTKYCFTNTVVNSGRVYWVVLARNTNTYAVP